MTPNQTNKAIALKLGWEPCAGKWLAPDGGLRALKDWYGSFSDAWDLVEQMEDYDFVLSRVDQKRWRVQTEGVTESADTASMAICLAFLKLNDPTL